MILDAVNQGYERIVWLDADTLWLGEPIETGQEAPLGMTFHLDEEYHHYNSGVIVAHASDKLELFLREWIDSSDENHKWWEQHPMNRLIEKSPGIAEAIGHEWNSLDYSEANRSDLPKIVAWHGRPDLACEGIAKWLGM
jgi:hypothetical protein